jgi:manganese transport protein
MSEKRNKRRFGPGMLVTAAFIGPGTVTTASMAGAKHGFELAWIVVLATIATIAFQEMAARLGVVTGKDLAESLRDAAQENKIALVASSIALIAILVGNAAFQGGNIAGATLGISTLSGLSSNGIAMAIAIAASALLWTGRMQLIQTVLTVLVAAMSAVFVVAMVLVNPDWAALLKAIVTPRVSEGSLILAIGLLGTTVVPYNLFLHSRSASAFWYEKGASTEKVADDVRSARLDISSAVSLGGLVTLAILVTAATAFFQKGVELEKLAQVAEQLRPVLGSACQVSFCLGLFAAGLTSAITAPLAAGIVAAGCFGWGTRLDDYRTRGVVFGVMAAGLIVVLLRAGKSPDQIIVIAQFANGLILPLIALFLLVTMNSALLPERFRNRWLANLVGCVVIAVVAILAWQQFSKASETWQKLFPPSG